MPEILSEIGDMEYKHLISSVHRVVSLIKVFKSTILTPQHLSGARLVEQRALALLKQWTLDNVITLTSDDLRNIRDIRAILWMFRARAQIVLCANHLFPTQMDQPTNLPGKDMGLIIGHYLHKYVHQIHQN